MTTFRDSVVVAHRWAALAAMIFLLIVAGTGCALVFEGAIDRGLHPELWRAASTGESLPVDTLTARARVAAHDAPITLVNLPSAAGRTVVIQAGGLQVFVDPVSGRIAGTRTPQQANATLARRLHVLHTNLMGGKIGGAIVALTTIVALLLVLSGLILWWREKRWTIRWSASWKRVIFDIHHATGVFAAVVLIVITSTGLLTHYGALNAAIVRALDEHAPAPAPKQPAFTGAGVPTTIGADSAAHAAMTALPGARPTFLSLPPSAKVPFVVAMRYPEDRTPGGRSRVFVDRFSGAVLGTVSTRGAPPGLRLSNNVRSLHTGDVLGMPTQAIWLLAALALVGQIVTGLLMWWNGRGARAAAKRRAAAAP